tara:strand:+ start:156 stop:392 length:237 start_codon:yes stop_codon:yes gene_type:complete
MNAIASIMPLPKAICRPNLSEKMVQITPPTNPPITAGRRTSNNEVGVPSIVSTHSQINTAELIATIDLKIRRTVNPGP